MATIVTRSGKGSPLTNNEVDANFTNLNTDKLESGDTAASLTITSADINGGTIDGVTIGGSSAGAITGTTGQFNTSLNVDGTVTADGLTVEPSASTGFTVGADGTNTYVNFEANSIAASVQQYYGQAAGTAFYSVGAKDSGGTLRTAFRIDGGGDISFYEDTGTTPKFFWDASAEALGIGTTSPSAPLEVSRSNAGIIQYITNTGSNQAYTAYGNSDNPPWSQDFGTPGGLLVGIDADETGVVYQGGNYALRFGTNATERMRIDSSGNLLVGTTTSPSDTGTIVADGVYLGGTVAANLLDDYEEGTWTPAFVGIGTGTYAVQLGIYTKIGNLVTVQCHLGIATAGSASGALQISGFPFAAINVVNAYGLSSSVHGTGWTTQRESLNILLQYNATTSNGVYFGMASTGVTQATHADMGTGNLLFSMTYRTT